MELICRGKKLSLNRTLIMGVLNVTPDSFSDGGEYFDAGKAIARGLGMEKEGADIIDIGGESTKPGAKSVPADEESARVIPVIEGLVKAGAKALISTDTYKSKTARKALEAGASIINDISGGTIDPEIMNVAAEYGAGYVIMHMLGTPGTMQDNPVYSEKGPVNDILLFFEERIKAALASGIKKENLILDPGIGFGKTLKHNFEILDSLDSFKKFGVPLLLGTSRKSLIGKVLNLNPDKRVYGTAATVAIAVAKGADLIRVHDVKEMKETADMAYAVSNYRKKEEK